jgi:SAM-dependent methyltransferase
MARRFALRGPRSLLAVPAAYRLFTGMVAGGFHRAYVDTYVRPRPGDRILDIGCGTGDILNYLPPSDYCGMDISAQYIEAARNQFGGRGTFVCRAVGEGAVDRPGTYDLAMANGVLHHLDDDTALELFRTARTALRPGGRLVTFDGCFVPGQSRVARWLLGLDRGEYVRPEGEYVRLASTVFPGVEARVRHNLLRIPYTHVIMECVA